MITNTPATGRITDEQALDNIATLLGTSPEWQSAADYLDHIANTIATTGRPHPGDQDPDQYQQLLAQHTKTRQPNTTQQLNELLAEYTDWAHTREQLRGREEAGTPVYADEWHDSDDTAVGILQDLVTAITTGHTQRTAASSTSRVPPATRLSVSPAILYASVRPRSTKRPPKLSNQLSMVKRCCDGSLRHGSPRLRGTGPQRLPCWSPRGACSQS